VKVKINKLFKIAIKNENDILYLSKNTPVRMCVFLSLNKDTINLQLSNNIGS